MAQSFTDGSGRVWQVTVDVAGLKAVRALTGIDLLKAGTKGGGEIVALQDALSSPVDVGDILYVLCKQQAESRRMTDEDFGRMLAGDVYGHAQLALVEAIVSFPEPGAGGAAPGDGEGKRGGDEEVGGDFWWRLIYEAAGIVGVDPATFTARELMWMAGGRMKAAWSVASWEAGVRVERQPVPEEGDQAGAARRHQPAEQEEARPQGAGGVGDLVGIFKAVIAAKKPCGGWLDGNGRWPSSRRFSGRAASAPS